MADNISLPGAGSVIASDDVSGVHFQKVKLDLGGDGLSAPLLAGQSTSGNSIPVVGPNDDQITVQVDIARPADTTAYAVNDALSDSTSAPTSGGFTLANMAKSSGGSGIITDVIVTSSNDPATPLQCEIVFFSQSVTAVNDNAAFAVSDGEIKTCLGKVGLALEDMGNNDFAHASGLAINYTCVGSANLRFLVRVKNAYTPASGEVVTVTVKAIRQ